MEYVKTLMFALLLLSSANSASAQRLGVGLIPGPQGPPGINGITQSQLDAVAATVPVPSTLAPPCVADTGTVGTGSPYAVWNHTHCSKARKDKVTTASNGLITVTFSTPFTTGVVPLCVATAFPAAGTTDIINVQGEGPPTSTQATFRVNRSTPTSNGLLSLTINVVPASPGAQLFHYVCLEP